MVLAGAIDADAADKASHLIMVADSFHLPLVFLADNPGMLPGTNSERAAILRSGARMFAAQTQATTPKVNVTIRKAYGFGSMVMAMMGFDHQTATFAYPGVTLGAMGAGASSRAMHSEASEAEMLRAAELDASYRSAANLGIRRAHRSARDAGTCSSTPSAGRSRGARDRPNRSAGRRSRRERGGGGVGPPPHGLLSDPEASLQPVSALWSGGDPAPFEHGGNGGIVVAELAQHLAGVGAGKRRA